MLLPKNSVPFQGIYYSSSGSTLSVHLSAPLLGCLVCVICNFKCLHSLISKLCNIIVYTLKMCTLYFLQISWIIFSFLGVLNLDIFSSKMLRWCLVCVICSSNTLCFHIIKLCKLIVHTLKMCTSYSRALNLDNFTIWKALKVSCLWNL